MKSPRTESLPPCHRLLDQQGQAVNAHGAGFLQVGATYYLYGEFKSGTSVKNAHLKGWDAYYIEPIGFSCYSSKDLQSWNFEGIVFEVDQAKGHIPPFGERVAERPKVIYNERTGKYVLWFHIDNHEYTHAHVGVATSDAPTGPFTFHRSFQPNGNESRDFTLFKDEDGTAYLIHSSENNETLRICRLTDDYLDCQPGGIRIFEKERREAPAVFKHAGRYYMITSGCTGWDPNPSVLASAEAMLGDWQALCEPCQGPHAETTFGSQCSYVLPLNADTGHYLMAADRWKKTDLQNSGYVWLPFHLDGANTRIEWQATLPKLEEFTAPVRA